MDSANTDVFDTIVVGSGPGGGTVARELSRRGQRVLILEWGRNDPVKGTATQAIRDLLTPGRGLLLTPGLLALGRGITTGGSSIFYYATAFDPPLEMFRSHGIELEDEVEELKAELPYGPLADELIGPFASRIMASARDLGYDWKPMPKLVFQNECRADCDKCTLGCPYGAKWTSRFFVEEAVEHGAQLVTSAKVDRVLTENGSAVGVEARQDGRRRRFFGSRVVVSAGGIGTPVILMSSGIADAGQDFFFDPLVVVMGSVDDLSGGREFPMATGIQMEEEGFVLTDLAWPRWMYQFFAAEVFRFDRLWSHGRTLPIMVKIRDELGGRLTARGGVRKALTDIDRQRLKSGTETAKKILRNAGAKKIFTTLRMATHPGGSAKVGDVVNTDLKTEIDNLYVCDCSVIPEAWGLPPTLTILALAKRLSKHIARETAAA